MIENISEVYEDVDIKLWASKIRENKIRDLKIIVDYFERELKTDNGNINVTYYIHCEQRVFQLKQKLEYLIHPI